MRMIKRWTTSVVSSFDSLMSQVENHEAVVNAAIRETQEAGAKAKVQLTRVRRDGGAMRKRLSELQEMERIWTDRAIRIEAEDKEKALECVRRRKQLKREIASLEEQIVEHTKLERQLGDDLKMIDERIRDLKRKKHAFAAREYRAKALNNNQQENLGIIEELDDIFERWETKLAECEVYASTSTDEFEEEFVSQEERKELEIELAELKQQLISTTAAVS